MNNTNTVKGYKAFNSDWSCTPRAGVKKQYTCPGKFEEEIDLCACHSGMHFCKRAADCFNYKSFDPNNKVAEVIAYGKVIEKGDKCCTDKLEIVREIPWANDRGRKKWVSRSGSYRRIFKRRRQYEQSPKLVG